jgi:hypothetical protein
VELELSQKHWKRMKRKIIYIYKPVVDYIGTVYRNV